MSDWKSFCLGDVVTFQRGYDLPKSKMINGIYPVIGSNGIIGWHNQFTTENPSITLGRSGNVGQPFIYYGKSWAHNTTLFIKEFKNVHPEFIYYLLKTLKLNHYAGGTAVPTLNRNHIKNIPIKLPPLDTQKKIAAVLSALDDKIELNIAINKNLEEQAQAIFDNFFYDKWNNGNFSVSSLDKIAEYLNGLAMQKFRPKENETGLPVLKIKELRQGFCDKESDSCSERIKPEFIIHAGDVIFSWSGTLLIDFWCGGLCGLNQHLFKVTSKSYGKWFYYLWTKYHLKRFIKLANDMATTMGHIKRKALTDSKVLIPDRENYLRLEKILQPICDKIIANRLENKKLGELRDTLLPRLMSGEIDVSAVEEDL